MNKRILAIMLSLIFILVNSTTLMAANIEDQVTQNKITAIKVVGNKKIKDEEILEQVKTKVGDKVSNEKLQEDMKKIFDLGYFFDIQITFKNHKDGVMLTFEVVENPELDEIKFIGNNEVGADKLKEVISVRPGQILNLNKLDESTQAINKYYQDEGYILAKVVDVTIKESDKLYVTINEGELNKIIINTDGETKDYVVRRELSMEPGQVFNVNQMWNDLRNIYNLGYFKDVKPQFKPVEGESQSANLVINLKEAKTGTFSVGGGYSSSSGMTGLINIEKDNLFGTGKRVKLNWEFGGKQNLYEIGFYEPWAFGTETSLNFNLYNRTEEDSNDNDVNEKGIDITAGHPITDNTNGYITLSYDNSDYYEEISDGSFEKADENTRSITLKTIRDTRDNFLNPKEGGRQELSIEKAGFGGDTNFAKYQTDLRKYIPVGNDDSLALRLKAGASNGTLEDIHKYQLRDGLLDGVRGYDSDYYNKTKWTDKNDNDKRDPGEVDYDPEESGFKGDSLLLANIEYRFDIVESVTGVVFADAGRTFQNNDFSLNDLNYSVGVGARFNTPIGQLGLDYGYAPEGDADHNRSFSLRIGNTF
ncbi:BamA/OMP85 family outer membrane protein [Orenia marismortui]|uniref:Beta-barrel assembly machine subunit BamA n=1 Tax=Orenia marismortui TaxID=46469 RepID=A0A4V3H034_9FIRM|nr:BamA/TamA family outer membrane protein [Orenia marismortui]TDX59189.1 Beta-barrel assembly machine subunit BamA [Orenia marismortui]